MLDPGLSLLPEIMGQSCLAHTRTLPGATCFPGGGGHYLEVWPPVSAQDDVQATPASL